jgi:hypothetical protein
MEEIIQKDRKPLYVIILVLVFIALFVALLLLPHGTRSSYRINDLSSNPLVVNELSCQVIRENPYREKMKNDGVIFESKASMANSYNDIDNMNISRGLSIFNSKETFFNENKLLVVCREGTFFKRSEIRRIDYKNNIVKLEYYLEDDQVFNSTDKKGYFILDFIRLNKGDNVSKVEIEDGLF